MNLLPEPTLMQASKNIFCFQLTSQAHQAVQELKLLQFLISPKNRAIFRHFITNSAEMGSYNSAQDKTVTTVSPEAYHFFILAESME